jgi:signal transduction histidine kinase
MACAQQINQVFLNLLVNAAHAIDAGGRIDVITRTLDGHVEVQIRDTGCGISEACRHRIFEPFFTTKEVGKGTGLGLHLVYRIITDHGGDIEVESVVGTGTAFTVRLPLNAPAGDDPRTGP